MTNSQKTNQPRRLEQRLKHYQSTIFSPAEENLSFEEYFELVVQDRTRHPGLHLMHDLWLRIVSLEYFLDLTKTCLATPKQLTRTSALVDALYFKESDGTLHNPLLKISDEIETPNFSSPESYGVYAQKYEPDVLAQLEEYSDNEAIKDLKQYAPEASMKWLHGLRREIKTLEARQTGILSCATMLANDSLDGDKRADMEKRLLRFWSGFKKNYAKLLEQDAFGDFEFTLEAVKKSLSGKKAPYLNTLPAKIYRRYKDYSRGTEGRSQWKFKNEKHESLEKTEEKTGFKRQEDEDENNSENTLKIKDILYTIEKLPPAERHAMEKTMNGEILTQAERKAKSRAIAKLKKIA